MSALTKTTPFLLAAMLIAGATACRKPAPAPQPAAQSKPAAAAATDDAARQRAQADQKSQAEAAAEAARKASAAIQDAMYHKAAETALQDVHFDFDQSDITERDKPVLVAIAAFMKTYPQAHLFIDGNCDERGTVEYNLGLGERRAHAALAYLVGLGVDAARLRSTSYGKEKPVCTDSTETCWGRNRRAHFTLLQ